MRRAGRLRGHLCVRFPWLKRTKNPVENQNPQRRWGGGGGHHAVRRRAWKSKFYTRTKREERRNLDVRSARFYLYIIRIRVFIYTYICVCVLVRNLTLYPCMRCMDMDRSCVWYGIFSRSLSTVFGWPVPPCTDGTDSTCSCNDREFFWSEICVITKKKKKNVSKNKLNARATRLGIRLYNFDVIERLQLHPSR